jgi:preprotein translocase subunit YajC
VNYWPYLIVLVMFGGFALFTQRARKRQLAQAAVRASRIGVGSEVMTTSGLYGTVVARGDDGTVTLAVAPGVEVRWAVAALRDADSLPEPYRRGIDDPDSAAAKLAGADAEDPAGTEDGEGKSPP